MHPRGRRQVGRQILPFGQRKTRWESVADPAADREGRVEEAAQHGPHGGRRLYGERLLVRSPDLALDLRFAEHHRVETRSDAERVRHRRRLRERGNEVELFRELDDSFGTAETLSSLAAIYRLSGSPSDAARLTREALPLYRRLGDRRGTAGTLIRLGVQAYATDAAQATELLTEALEVCRELDDAQGIVACLTYLARLPVVPAGGRRRERGSS